MSWAIVVPILNEIETLPVLLEHLAEHNADQVILVDGGSTDGTCELLQTLPHNFRVVHSAAGRASQMNAGAKTATQDVLLFLHADTCLPKNTYAELSKGRHWGRFDVQFDSKSLAMKVIAWFINCRSRMSGIATGDQAIFMSRQLFEQVQGFPDQPLMEDVALSRQLKALARPYCSTSRVTTSARRWEQNGVIKTVLQMWFFRLAYFFGASPEKLKRRYLDLR